MCANSECKHWLLFAKDYLQRNKCMHDVSYIMKDEIFWQVRLSLFIVFPPFMFIWQTTGRVLNWESKKKNTDKNKIIILSIKSAKFNHLALGTFGTSFWQNHFMCIHFGSHFKHSHNELTFYRRYYWLHMIVIMCDKCAHTHTHTEPERRVIGTSDDSTEISTGDHIYHN